MAQAWVCRRIPRNVKNGAFSGEIPYSGGDVPHVEGEFNLRRESGMPETIEKPKKAKSPAKPRVTAATSKKTTAKKQTVSEQMMTTPTREEIARLAQQYWAERGHQDGLAEQDWLRAEQELMKMAS
jgi:hypothetical protein